MTGPETLAGQLIALARAADPVITGARALAAAGLTGDPHGQIRARRLIETIFAGSGVVPVAADYEHAAAVLRGEGRTAEAALFSVAERLEPRLRAAEARWQERHGTRVSGPVSRDLDHGGQAYRLTPAVRGIDGNWYQAGEGEPRGTVVVVRGGHGSSVFTGWCDRQAAWEWIWSRLPGRDGPLDPPAGLDVPLVREEQVLAFLLRAPWELDRAHEALRGYRWTAHCRDEIFSAARAVSWRGHAVDAASVTAEAVGRYAWQPDWARDDLGGPGVPHLAVYVRRPARTPVTPDSARGHRRTHRPATRGSNPACLARVSPGAVSGDHSAAASRAGARSGPADLTWQHFQLPPFPDTRSGGAA